MELQAKERAVTCKMLLHLIDMSAVLTQSVEQQCEPKREFKMYLNQYFHAGQKLYKYFENNIISKNKDWQLMNDVQDDSDKMLQMLRAMTLAVGAPEIIDRITEEYITLNKY